MQTPLRLRKYTHKQSGFTIIELLVVLAVVGILLVLGLPGFKAAYKAYNERTTSHEQTTPPTATAPSYTCTCQCQRCELETTCYQPASCGSCDTLCEDACMMHNCGAFLRSR